MVFTSVNMRLHQGTNGFMGFMDEVINNKFYNFGVQAYSALKAHKTIDIKFPNNGDYNGEEYIIPYHAVMEWSVTKEEDEYTKPEDEFCKSESTPTDDITLVDGTYTFENVDGGTGEYEFELSKCYAPTNVTVTIDETTVTLPKLDGDVASPKFGGWDDDKPVFTTYPAAVQFWSNGYKQLYVGVATSGEHTVKVTVPSGSEVECGGK